MNLGTTRLRIRPRNIWQDEVREDGRIVGGEGWQEKGHVREELKKLLRMARNCCILHMPMEWMNFKTVHHDPKIFILLMTLYELNLCLDNLYSFNIISAW